MFLPQQPADRYADLLIASDVLLLSERPEMVNMSLPGKLTSYVTAGKPIVAAVASGGATAAEVERSGAGDRDVERGTRRRSWRRSIECRRRLRWRWR